MGWRDWRLSAYLALAGLAWSVVVGLVFYVAPLATSVSTSSDGTSVTRSERIFTGSPVEAWPLLVPVALCAAALWAAARHHRRVLIAAFTVLAFFCFIAGFSIGLFYLPAAALLVGSIVTSQRRPAGV